MTDTTVIMGSGDTDVKDSCPVCGGKVRVWPCLLPQSSYLFSSRCSRRRRWRGSMGSITRQAQRKENTLEYLINNLIILFNNNNNLIINENSVLLCICPQKCFKCSKCKRPLDYGSLAEGPDSQLYCKELFHLIYLCWLLTSQIYICSDENIRKAFSELNEMNPLLRTAMQWNTATSLNPTSMMLTWLCSR